MGRLELRDAILTFKILGTDTEVVMKASDGDLRYISNNVNCAIHAQFYCHVISPAAGMTLLQQADRGSLEVLYTDPSGSSEKELCEFQDMFLEWRGDKQSRITLMAMATHKDAIVSRPKKPEVKAKEQLAQIGENR